MTGAKSDGWLSTSSAKSLSKELLLYAGTTTVRLVLSFSAYVSRVPSSK